AEAVASDVRRGNAHRLREPVRGSAHGENGRLLILSQRQLIFGTLEAETAQRFAERGIGLVERLPTNGERVGQRFAHADFLRSLSGKNERDQWWATAAAAISRSSRSMEWLEANR